MSQPPPHKTIDIAYRVMLWVGPGKQLSFPSEE